jgi:hypothetical protein
MSVVVVVGGEAFLLSRRKSLSNFHFAVIRHFFSSQSANSQARQAEKIGEHR